MPEELMDDSNALGYLRAEHEAIQELMVSLSNTDEPEFARQVMKPLLRELQIHSTIEQDLFFPFMCDRLPEDVVSRPAEDNVAIAGITRTLATMSPADPQFLPTLDSLIKKFQHHVYLEEQFLFLPVVGQDADTHNALVKLANLMKTRREELLKRMDAPRKASAGEQAVPPSKEKQPLQTADQKLSDFKTPTNQMSDANIADKPIETDFEFSGP